MADRYPAAGLLLSSLVRRSLALACLILALLAPSAAAQSTLQRVLSSAMRSAGGASGADAIDVTHHQELFSWNAASRRTLASNTKLFTLSAVLDRFGPDATLPTRVYAGGPIDSAGVLNGNLYLRGGGDPTFGDTSFVRGHTGGSATVENLAKAVENAGITQVNGHVVGDESLFDSLRGGPDSGFGVSFYVGPLSALSFDRGLANSRGSAFQSNPPKFAAGKLDAALRKAGVRVRRSASTGTTPDGATLVGEVDSPPMSRLATLTAKESDNYFAEMLEKDLAAGPLPLLPPPAPGQPPQGFAPTGNPVGTTTKGARAAIGFAKTVGARPKLVDGSGLDRLDQASPRDVATLLDGIQTRPWFQSLFDALPVAGRDGTLHDRMRHGAARGKCHAKTGTLSNVSALSGYCQASSGDTVVFSILMNRVSPVRARAQQDRMAAALVQFG
jgi:D-alanyl-D-alanine carboxypeptidase/D-alanyl-D-alanine-endopeptidase (penicillin-binding protein 4)